MNTTINTTVTSKGGNQYLVEIDGKAEPVDLDGLTIMSDEDYNRLEAANLLDLEMECPKAAREAGVCSGHELAAIEHKANYSGFVAEEYTRNHS